MRSPDLLAAGVGLIAGAIIIVISYAWHIQQQDIGTALFLACGLYLLLRRKLSAPGSTPSTESNTRMLLLSNIVFLLAFTAFILLTKFHTYDRPVIFFVTAALAVATIIFEVFYTPEDNRYVSLLAFKIIILSIAVRAAIFYEFPTMMGSDAWWHSRAGTLLAQDGHMDAAIAETGYLTSRYQYFPLYHILVAATELITNLGEKTAVFMSIGLASAVSTVFVYLAGKNVAGARVGLIAMLILSVSDMLILRGVINITTGSLVLCYFIFLLFLMVRQRPATSATTAFMIMLIPAIVLSHQLTVFASLLMVFFIYIGTLLYKLYNNNKTQPVSVIGSTQNLNLSLMFIVVFGVSILAYWTYFPPPESGGGSFLTSLVYRLLPVFERQAFDPLSGAYTASVGSYSVMSNFLYHAGYVILLFLAATGALIWLHPRRIGRVAFSIVFAVLLLLAITYISPLTALKNALIPHRFLPFAYIILGLLSARAILGLTGLFKHNLHRALLASAVALVFTFFSLTTPYICPDTPYARDRAARTGFRTSEVQAAATIARIYQGNLMMEARAARLYEYVVPEHALIIREMKMDVAGEFEGMVMLGRVLLVRETHVGGSGTFGTGEYIILGQEYFDIIDRIPESVLVYDNGEVIAYLVK